MVAVASIAWFRSHRITAEKVVAFIAEKSLREMSPGERSARIGALADRVNHLDFEERQKFRLEKRLRAYFLEMTDAERARYLDLTLPSGMKNMMEAFNKMTPQKRKRVIDRAVTELSRVSDQGDRAEMEKALGDENLKKVVTQGMKSYLSEASAQTKLDLQPLVEQVQNILQMGR